MTEPSMASDPSARSPLATLARVLPDVLFLIDPEGRVSYISPAWETITGYTVAETIGRDALEMVDPRDRASLAMVFTRVWERADAELRYEARCVTKHGRDTWLEGHLHVATVEGEGQLMGGTLRDVTAKHDGLGAIASGLNDLRFILDALPGMSFVTDENGQVIHVSAACERMFGAGMAPFVGTNWRALLHPDDADRIRRQADTSQQLHAPFSTALRLRAVDGVWRHMQLIGVPRFTDDGVFRGHLGFLHDETAAREAEARHEQHNRLFATLLDSLVVAVFVADAEGRVLISNQAGKALLARSSGRGILQLARAGGAVVLREDGSQMPEDEWPFTLVRRTSEPQLQRKLGVQWPSGEVQWFLVSYRRVPAAHGAWPDDSVMSSWEDVTRDAEHARLAEAVEEKTRALRLANEDLARSARMKDEFLASMSHELRTPLNAVLGLSEAMIEEVFGDVNDKQREALHDVALSGRHLLALINDILDLSKVAAGKMDPEFDWTDLTETCEAAVRMVQPVAAAKRQKIEVRLGDGATVRWSDPRWMRQIVVNLLTNAVKFTPEGGKVTLEVILATRDVTIVVSDTGIGIEAAEQSRVFEPFVQLRQGLNRPHAGTGLGLALVRALAERLGGTVVLESAPARGSTFRVSLPLAAEHAAGAGNALTGEASTLDPLTELPHRRILLAEDNEANVRTFVAYLQAKGYEVDVARNGQLAVAMVRAQPYDAVLMDVQMPVMDGLKATQILRAEPAFSRLPIIALTAFAMPGDRERCLEAGANDHVSKPVRLRALVSLIEKLCVEMSAPGA
ncbi:MAG: PAS domain S-box protein [Gemmatimonadota bacterium]|nr:PAS domain S-box protein [Gemmatimonadota bacterium]